MQVQGRPVQVEIRTKPMPDQHGRLSVSIFMKDQYDNPVPMEAGSVRIETMGDFDNLQERLEWTLSRKGLLLLHGVCYKGKQSGRIKVIDEVTGSEMVSHAILPGPINGMRHSFGEIHFHTGI
ncbi:hypothetical protein [Paenibacillus roseipurpureus]|uniref:Uncharacterized protein n=1 Tax=Paenibacillus roseopurpureus TaxID=2918901 RepID=A0AA96LLU6_9BACL|nr:hypothetical protein [Paenibacillus sp. MBLB1832]WNR43486.1 hypothetical protein MJB10_20605 [Paenibacillus sp. MBLB1832]